jgi:hypothetical protein
VRAEKRWDVLRHSAVALLVASGTDWARDEWQKAAIIQLLKFEPA